MQIIAGPHEMFYEYMLNLTLIVKNTHIARTIRIPFLQRFERRLRWALVTESHMRKSLAQLHHR